MKEEEKINSETVESETVKQGNVESEKKEEEKEDIINPEELEKIIEEEPKKVDDVLTDIVIDEKNKKKIDAKDIKVGMFIRIYQRIFEKNAKGEEKGRLQMYEGLVIAKKHGNEAGSTITVRKVTKNGYVVERIYPTFLPTLEKIELLKIAKKRKSKMYFLRESKARKLKFEK